MKTFTISVLSFFLGLSFSSAQTIQYATPVGLMLHGGGVQPSSNDGSNSTSYTVDRLQLYPNPSSDIVHVIINLPQQENVHVCLYNLLGQSVWSADLGKALHIETTVPVQELANGVYLLQVKAGNTLDERKIVVAK